MGVRISAVEAPARPTPGGFLFLLIHTGCWSGLWILCPARLRNDCVFHICRRHVGLIFRAVLCLQRFAIHPVDHVTFCGLPYGRAILERIVCLREDR